MINKLNFNPKMEKLREYLSYLKGYQKYSADDLKKDYTLQGAVLHYLQLSIECTIDIGETIISELRLPKPEEAKEIFKILAENKIIPEDFARRFSLAAGFRNILVHEYAEVDLIKVHSYLKNNLSDFDSFAKSIAQFIRSHK